VEGTIQGWILYVITPFNGSENFSYSSIQKEIMPPFNVTILFLYLPFMV